MTQLAYSVLVPTRALGRSEYKSIHSVTSAAAGKLSDITVAVDPRCSDYSWADRISELPQVNLVTAHLASRSVGAILNDGLRYCQSRSILRHDADDFWMPGRESLQLSQLVRSGGIVFGQALQAIGRRIRRPLYPAVPCGQLWGAALIFGNPIIHPTVAFDRLAVDQRPYTEGIQAEDYELWLRAATAGTPMTAHRGYVTIYTRHAGQVSRRLRVEDLATECGPLVHSLAGHYLIGSLPNLEVLVCNGDCTHDADVLSDFFQVSKAALDTLLTTDRRQFERYKALLFSRVWAVAARHRMVLSSAGLNGLDSVLKSLPLDGMALSRVAYVAGTSLITARSRADSLRL